MEKNQQKRDKRYLLIRYFKALEKTMPETEIENRWCDLMRRVEQDKKPVRRSIWIYAKIACVAALLGGIVWFSLPSLTDTTSGQFDSAVAELEQQPADTSKQIVLITHSQKKIPIDKGSVVAYTQEGVVSVDEKRVEEKTQKTEYNRLIVPKGKYSRLVLADGSSLYVNAGTKVVYPNQFDGKKREIYVDGEVFIDVKRDESKPFVVKTSEFNIRVLGTAFNVNAYKDMENAEVVLLRGSVMVKDRSLKETTISPNELLDLTEGVVVDRRVVNAGDYTAWTRGRLPLVGKSMKSILHRLSLFYGIEIGCEASLEKYPLYGTLDLSVPLEKVLERISKTTPIRYEKTEDGIYLYEK